MVRQILLHFAIQLLCTVGMVVITGLTVSGAKRVFLKGCGNGAFRVEQVTGLIGTPIHELSHALFCLLFGHKITGICLWSPRAEDGHLGYVSHTYRKRNLWHRIGNFFIGVAPILGGSAVLLFLLYLLLPNTAQEIFGACSEMIGSHSDVLLQTLSANLLKILKAFAVPEGLLHFHTYVFGVLAFPILLHMEISRADLSSGAFGFLFLALTVLFSDVLLFFLYPFGLSALTTGAICFGAVLLLFFTLVLLLSALLLVLAFLMWLVRLVRNR